MPRKVVRDGHPGSKMEVVAAHVSKHWLAFLPQRLRRNEPLGAFSETECGSKTSSIILRREKVKVHLIQLTLHREPEAQELNPLLMMVLVQHIISHTHSGTVLC